MNTPIWSVVVENLAEQIAATQAGCVHPTQLMPYLPLDLELIEKALDGMLCERVVKERESGLACYMFVEHFDSPVSSFRPTRCVYSDEPLKAGTQEVVTDSIRQQIERELAVMAASSPWPSFAIWQHELVYLISSLPAPVQLSVIAGHSRMRFKKTEERLVELQKRGAVYFDLDSGSYSVAPMDYERKLFQRNETFIRTSPGALKEEDEVKLVKGLFGAFVILAFCFLLAITARIPFPILFFGGLIASVIYFVRVFRAPPKALPKI